MSKSILQKDIKDIFKMEVSMRNILIIVGTGIAVCVYCYLGLYPKYKEYISTKEAVKKSQEKLISYQEKIIRMPKLKEYLESVSSELRVKSKELSHDMQDGMFLIGLDKKLKEFSVNLTNYSIEDAIKYEKFYAVPTTIDVRGDYRSVREIMYYLENQKNITQIMDYSMRSYIDNENNISQNKFNNITGASLTLNSIVYWNQDSTIYHVYNDCSLLDRSKAIITGKLSDRENSTMCTECSNRIFNVNNVTYETPKAKGQIEAQFKFIMYTNEEPTMKLDTDDPYSWKPGKYNPFISTVR